jgi:chromosome segregation ATPase
MKYTITSFSEKFNIPKDEIIKNLNTTYKAYVTKERGITYIDEQAARQEQTEVKIEETVSTISEEQKELNNNNALIDGYKAQINELKQELAKEREKNSETEAKLLEMMDKVIKLTENTQILMAQIQSQHQLLIENSKKKRTIRELFSDFIKKEP